MVWKPGSDRRSALRRSVLVRCRTWSSGRSTTRSCASWSSRSALRCSSPTSTRCSAGAPTPTGSPPPRSRGRARAARCAAQANPAAKRELAQVPVGRTVRLRGHRLLRDGRRASRRSPRDRPRPMDRETRKGVEATLRRRVAWTLVKGRRGRRSLVTVGSEPPRRRAGVSASAASVVGRAARRRKLPRDFVAKGRYIVPDLGIDVPFTWEGHDGDSQMIAGSDDVPDPLHQRHRRRTALHADVQVARARAAPLLRGRRVHPGGFNQFLATSRYAGAEILVGKPNRRVHHFRAGVVWEPPPSVVPPDVLTPVGGTPDIGTGGRRSGAADPAHARRLLRRPRRPDDVPPVLHFGVQNLYDAELDEWMVMKTFRHRPGTVDLPDECKTAAGAPGS